MYTLLAPFFPSLDGTRILDPGCPGCSPQFLFCYVVVDVNIFAAQLVETVTPLLEPSCSVKSNTVDICPQSLSQLHKAQNPGNSLLSALQFLSLQRCLLWAMLWSPGFTKPAVPWTFQPCRSQTPHSELQLCASSCLEQPVPLHFPHQLWNSSISRIGPGRIFFKGEVSKTQGAIYLPPNQAQNRKVWSFFRKRGFSETQREEKSKRCHLYDWGSTELTVPRGSLSFWTRTWLWQQTIASKKYQWPKSSRIFFLTLLLSCAS